MDQHCLRINHLSHTVAESHAPTTWDLRVARPLRKTFGKTVSLKITNTPNVVSMACKDLNHLICFNSDKKGQAKEEQKYLRRLVIVLKTSALIRLTWTVPQRLPWNGFLAFDTRFNSGKMNVGFDGQGNHDSHVGFDGQYGHDSHEYRFQ